MWSEALCPSICNFLHYTSMFAVCNTLFPNVGGWAELVKMTGSLVYTIQMYVWPLYEQFHVPDYDAWSEIKLTTTLFEIVPEVDVLVPLAFPISFPLTIHIWG